MIAVKIAVLMAFEEEDLVFMSRVIIGAVALQKRIFALYYKIKSGFAHKLNV